MSGKRLINMGRLPENPSSDQTPPPQPQSTTVQTPFQQRYPNHLSPPPPQDDYTVFHSYPSEQTKQHPIYPPQQPPLPAAYPPEPQPAATYHHILRSPVANGTTYYNPQMYNDYTPNHTSQPQAVNYAVTAPPVATGTPNWFQPQVPISVQEWTTGLFGCFDDPENAIMTLCFPCVTFGQIAEIADNGQTSCATSGLIYSLIIAFIGIPCIMSCSYRTKLRSRYNLIETPAPDWVIHLFCEYCALCQEYRELKNRGMDPALGWQGNLSKQQRMANHATMTPPINQRMMG